MKITNIEQLLPFVDQKDEFIVIQKEGVQIIDYVYQTQDTFDIPELMECRGIKFCPQGLILARPFRKFFNYGEQGSDLPVHRPHYITEKLDGSMVHAILLGRHLFLHTRKGHTDVAKKAERHMMSTPRVDYVRFMRRCIADQWTPIFEYTGPNNRIVLRYEEEALTLVALRHIIMGDIMPREHLVQYASWYNVPVVALADEAWGNVEEFVAHARGLIDAEGFVVYFDDGYMVKIKAEDYVLKHRALDDLGSKKKVVALCVQGFVDDVVAVVSEEDGEDLNIFNDDIQAEINRTMAKVLSLVSWYTELDVPNPRKEFALLMDAAGTAKYLRAAAFASIDGKNARLVLTNHLIRYPEMVETQWRGD